MSVRRTLKQKETTHLSRSELITYSLPHSSHSQSEIKTPLQPSVPAIFGYDIKLIYRDILKTVVVTTAVLSILGVIVVTQR